MCRFQNERSMQIYQIMSDLEESKKATSLINSISTSSN